MTEWRMIPGFSDYAVSDDGQIKALRRSPGHRIGAPIQTPVDHRGYPRTRLIGDDGRPHTVSPHVAILEAFVGLRPRGHDASHLNGIRTDNRLSNLCWETSSENHRRKLAHGTLIHGERHKCSKLTAAQVREIRSRKGEKVRDIGAEFGVSGTLVSRIQRGIAWPHVA